jgi:molybdopterin/thiamine biosynthesis adenylyltransferase
MLKPMIKRSHHILKNSQGDICIGELPGSAFIVRSPPQAFIDLLHLLNGDYSRQRLAAAYKKKHPNIKEVEASVNQAIDKLSELNLLEDASLQSKKLTQQEMELYDRQILYFTQVDSKGLPGFAYQERLKDCRVAVFGLGGWGTWVSQLLALTGFGMIRLVDGDDVEVSNLNRQVLYRFPHVGMAKADAAAESISAINPFVKTEPIKEYVTGRTDQIERLLDNIDLLFLAWVNLSSFTENSVAEKVHDIALKKGIKVVEFGGDPQSIFVGPVYTNDGGSPTMASTKEKLHDFWYEQEKPDIRSFREARIAESYIDGNRLVNAWQTSPSLSIMAGMAVDQAVKVVTECEPAALVGKRFYMSLQDYEIKEIDF